MLHGGSATGPGVGGAAVIQVIMLNGGSSSARRPSQPACKACCRRRGCTWASIHCSTRCPRRCSPRRTASRSALTARSAQDRTFGAWKRRGCAGVHIIIDEVFLSGVDARTRWQAALNDVSVLWVGVHCDPAVAAERERGRSGHGHITTQLVHSGMAYDVEVDTSDT